MGIINLKQIQQKISVDPSTPINLITVPIKQNLERRKAIANMVRERAMSDGTSKEESKDLITDFIDKSSKALEQRIKLDTTLQKKLDKDGKEAALRSAILKQQRELNFEQKAQHNKNINLLDKREANVLDEARAQIMKNKGFTSQDQVNIKELTSLVEVLKDDIARDRKNEKLKNSRELEKIREDRKNQERLILAIQNPKKIKSSKKKERFSPGILGSILGAIGGVGGSGLALRGAAGAIGAGAGLKGILSGLGGGLFGMGGSSDGDSKNSKAKPSKIKPRGKFGAIKGLFSKGASVAKGMSPRGLFGGLGRGLLSVGTAGSKFGLLGILRAVPVIGPIASAAISLASFMAGGTKGFMNTDGSLWEKLWGGLKLGIASMIGATFGVDGETILSFMTTGANFIKNTIIAPIKQYFSEGNILENIANGLVKGLGKVYSYILDIAGFDDVAREVEDMTKHFSIRDIIKSTTKSIRKFVDNTVDKFLKFVSDAKEWMANIVSSFTDPISNYFGEKIDQASDLYDDASSKVRKGLISIKKPFADIVTDRNNDVSNTIHNTVVNNSQMANSSNQQSSNTQHFNNQYITLADSLSQDNQLESIIKGYRSRR